MQRIARFAEQLSSSRQEVLVAGGGGTQGICEASTSDCGPPTS